MYPTLLALPLEIRDQILELLFFGAELPTLCKCHRPNPFQRANYGILAANKQHHHAASAILFRGAVLRLEIPQIDDYVPYLATKTVLPVWSWYVRDRYRDNGTDPEFLRRWQGLKRVRHFEMSLTLLFRVGRRECKSRCGRYPKGCQMAVDLLNGLPEAESLTVYTDADAFRWMEKCEEILRALKIAKIVILADIGSCGHKS